MQIAKDTTQLAEDNVRFANDMLGKSTFGLRRHLYLDDQVFSVECQDDNVQPELGRMWKETVIDQQTYFPRFCQDELRLKNDNPETGQQVTRTRSESSSLQNTNIECYRYSNVFGEMDAYI